MSLMEWGGHETYGTWMGKVHKCLRAHRCVGVQHYVKDI